MKAILLLLTLCSVCSQIHLHAVQEDTTDPAGEARDQHFFVGVNLSIPHGEEFYPIEGIWERKAYIKVGEQTLVKKIDQIEKLRYARKTKISSHFAQIDDLQCEPGYSPGNDPRSMAARRQVVLAELASQARALSDAAAWWAMEQEGNDAEGESTFEYPMAGGAPPSADAAYAEADALMGLAEIYEDQIYSFQDSEGSEEPTWDLLNINFSIKSDDLIPLGCLAFIFRLKEKPEGKPVMTWFHFLDLENISPEGKRYQYQVHSYPAGMYIDSTDVLLYAYGSEIATNLSPKHVQMTEDAARKVLNYQYLKQNEGETRPPQPNWKYLSSVHLHDLYPDLADEKVTLKIDEEGLVTDLIISPDLRDALTPESIHEISSQVYLPALETGQPVPGELQITLKDVVF